MIYQEIKIDKENIMSYSLVTGASSGIGLEICKLLAKDKNNLILVSRSEKELLKLKKELEDNYKIHVYVIVKDLAEHNAALDIYHEALSKGFIVDKLINNAGFASFGRFSEIETHVDIPMIDVNVRALTYLTKLFLSNMIKNKEGKILNIASTAAFFPGPYMAVYYASKAYVLSLSEALASELKNTGVTVSALCPGPTKTAFQNKAKMKKSEFVKFGVMDAYTVALCGYKGMLKGKQVIVPGVLNKFLINIIRFLPRSIVTSMAKATQNID